MVSWRTEHVDVAGQDEIRPTSHRCGQVGFPHEIGPDAGSPNLDRHRPNRSSRGPVRELHAARSEFKAYVDEQIAMLEWVASGKMLAGRGVPFGRLVELEEALAEIKKFRNDLFAQWNSIDDLYGLAVRDFRYSAEKFDAYVAAHPIPQSWYDETEDLFTPAPE